MAMITCAECGTEVSTSAKSCPNCGASRKAMRYRPRQPMSKTQKWLWAGIALFGIVVVILAASLPPAPKSPERQKEDHEEALRIEAAKAAVADLRASLRNPDSLTFQKIGVTEDGGTTCIHFRAQNGFGGMNAEDFVFSSGRHITTAQAWHHYCYLHSLYDYTDTLPMVIGLTGPS